VDFTLAPFLLDTCDMGNHKTAKTLSLVMIGVSAAALGSSCSKSSNGGPGGAGPLPEEVQSIVFLQRKPRTDTGNVFEYTSYVPGGRLVMLSPPAANGTLTVLTSDPMFENADIMSYDLSFDAKAVLFSARLAGSGQYHIFSMNMDGTNLKQLSEGGNDYVYPLYLPGGKIFFTTNRNVENDLSSLTFSADAKQFKDEYERATTAQVGTMNLDGTNQQLGPRNVSHRVSPALLPDGHVLYSEWRHMGGVNDGHLRMMNADMTGMREAFGGEDGGNGGTNSYLKARVVQSKTMAGGAADIQLVAISTSRDRTLQAGKLFLIDLNGNESASHFSDMTPLVPGGREKSNVGRYYDAEAVGNANLQQFLVSWADGPVESEILDLAQTQANFGIYLFDNRTHSRYPIFDDPAYWDVLARPVLARAEPPVTASAVSGGTSTIIGALNVYDSSVLTIPAGSVQKVRLIEGFSAEEGIGTFGSTEFDGQSVYGEIPLQKDNSFTAAVPGNVPFHIQLVDKFAMSVANESIWISGRAGEKRVCGGCHENRAKTPLLAPGQVDSVLSGAVNLDIPRAQRITPQLAGGGGYDFSYGSIRGVPWDKAIQPMLTAKCASCHDGDASKAYNPTFTVMDLTTGTSQTFTFDLRGQQLNVVVGERMTGAFTASYISVMGLGEILGEDVVKITGAYNQYGYVTPGSAKDSPIIKQLNPPQRFPAIDAATRAFAAGGIHPNDVGHPEWELTPEEYYRFILNIDLGGQFYFRENRDSATAYNMGKI
jgi:Hydrazine synthase alpha subunit middle domain